MKFLAYLSLRMQMLSILLAPVAVLIYFAVTSNVVVAISGIVLSIACAFFISQQIKKRLVYAQRVAGQISDERIHEEIDVQGKDEISYVVEEIKSTQKKLLEWGDWQITELENTTRIKNGLDNVHASVVLLDAELKILYVNDNAKEMFARDEEYLKKDIPSFDSDGLIGSSIDLFFKRGSTEFAQLANLQTSLESELAIGGRTFQIIANPVTNEQKQQIGVVLEWEDRTEALHVQSELKALVDAALKGDLSKRITTEGKKGFYKFLSVGINDLVNVSEKVVNDTTRVMSALSQGNLTERIDTEYHGDYDQLKNDANKTIAKLTEIVTNIKDSSGLISSATNEISEGNLNLSHRTEQQASNLEETSSSMVEMTSTVQKNAENSQQANKLAISASEQAEEGGRVVSSAISAMNEINDSSAKISDIIGVIDEIAFQTNLLALNAAVEAARAGEQGRGFAVVASEVRNLAGRSATAAKEIKELIEDSVNKVEEGSRLVHQSGKTLDGIMAGVKEVADIIGDISMASQEQATGIDMVNKSVIQMEEATQQNAALVEQVSATAESMKEQSNELNSLVKFFYVNDQDNEIKETAGIYSNDLEEGVEIPIKKVVGEDFDDSDWEEF